MTPHPPLPKLPQMLCISPSLFSQEIKREIKELQRNRVMEDMASLWFYQESHDELKQKLMYTTFELESVRAEFNEEIRKNNEYVKQLVQLVKIACQERDEARDQLQKLLTFPALPQFEPETPLIKPAKANSSITTESNSLSADTYNHHSHGSSPSNSFFDPVSSPEPSTINMADSSQVVFVNANSPFVQDYTGTVPMMPKIDRGTLAIDNIVKGKTLPQKGKLLQAVLEAGPILQNLLVAGPLPRWRNPPPLQAFQIPPVTIKGADGEMLAQESAHGTVSCVPKMVNSSSFVEMSCGSSQMLSTPTSMLNFAAGASGSCYVPSGKRQRFQ